MNWFQRLSLYFKRKWKSIVLSATLVAAIGAGVAVWTKIIQEKQLLKKYKNTITLMNKHKMRLAKAQEDSTKFESAIHAAQACELEAETLIVQEKIPEAKKKLKEGIRLLTAAMTALENIQIKELEAEFAVILARIKQNPELIEDADVDIDEIKANIEFIREIKKRLGKSIPEEIERMRRKLGALG